MNLSIERARSRKPITLLTIIGVLLLPVIIGGILVAALQNPTERLDTMTAAIVNEDEPVTIDDQYTPLGRQLAAGLVEGSDDMDSNLTWVISNDEDAAAGLADGSYQAVVTIPSEFSTAATSAGQTISDGDGNPEQATIEVTTPDDGLVADDLITSQISSVAADTMGTTLSEATTENILVGFTTIGDQIGEAATGADELATGARSAADGAAELPDGATQLADGVTELGTGAAGLATGATEISDGAGQLTGGASQLADGATSLAGGLDTIAGKTREAGAGATQLGQGLLSGADAVEANGIVPGEVVSGAQDLAAGAGALAEQCRLVSSSPEFCDELDNLAAGAGQSAGGIEQVAAQAPGTVAAQLREAGNAANTFGGGLDQLAAGVDQSAAGARDLSTGAAGLRDGAAGITGGATQLADGATQLSTGATQLSDGATALADGADELATGLDDLATGNAELADGLHQATDQLPSFSDQESTSLASVIADPVSSNGQSNTIFGPTAIPLLTAVVLWFGGLASFLVMRAHTTRTLTSRRSSAGLTLRAFWPAAAIGAGQGVLVSLIVQIVASYDVATWWAFAGTAVLAGVAFAAVNQALVALFGGIGRWISALVGVVAVATGLISTVPGWLSAIGAALPTAPAFTGLISANGSAAAGLVVWGVLSLVVTTIAIALRRTTSAKAVLA
ncbi:YhgE/Pip family protein [Microbacterium sp.]|uniref:YhgE/Pip family protein n=1 Tax=Microbacterium sp. TaxID=51671 RepID=UPI003F9C2788